MEPPNPLDSRAQVAALQRSWLALLRMRHPNLAAHHMDLAQDAAVGLLAWLRDQDRDVDEDELRRVGHTILNRRVSDHFRDPVRRWMTATAESLETQTPQREGTPVADPSDKEHYRGLLESALRLLVEMSAADRKLIMESVQGKADAGVRSDAERKRLSRLRQELRRQLLESLTRVEGGPRSG